MWAGTKANSFIGGYYIDDFCTDFQTPFVGHRRYEDGSLESQNESVNFWSSSSSSYDDSWSFFLGEDSANAHTEDIRSWGYSVRCFKDSSVASTSSEQPTPILAQIILSVMKGTLTI